MPVYYIRGDLSGLILAVIKAPTKTKAQRVWVNKDRLTRGDMKVTIEKVKEEQLELLPITGLYNGA